VDARQVDRPDPAPGADERHLILLRYGESDWNRENRFTGGTDVDFSTAGIAEAHTAARLLREAGLAFYVAFTSVLKQAIRTLWIVQDDLDRMSGAGPCRQVGSAPDDQGSSPPIRCSKVHQYSGVHRKDPDHISSLP